MGAFNLRYCVKLGEWGSVFAVPSSVVDKHIKLVGSCQLKVLLWILRNSDKEFSEEEMAAALSIHQEEIRDSINYWVESGLLKRENNSLAAQEGQDSSKGDFLNYKKEIKEVEEVKEEEKAQTFKGKPRPTSRMLTLDSSYIAERIKSSKEIEILLQEAQLILGRPISTGDSAVLIMLLDNEGLPIDVILMIIQYAVSIGKANMRYIEAVGISWASEDIDTLEKAENKIKSLSETRKAWRNFEQIIGGNRQPTSREEEAVNRWYNIWNYNTEMIKEAYEICVNSNGKYVLKYMDGIISRWHKEGIINLNQLKDEKNKHSKKFKNAKEEPSYNIEEYEKYDIFNEISLGMNGEK